MLNFSQKLYCIYKDQFLKPLRTLKLYVCEHKATNFIKNLSRIFWKVDHKAEEQ